MNRRLARLLPALFAPAVITVAGLAFAGDATDFVKTKQTQLFTALKASDDKKVEALFDETLDYDAVVSGAMGSNKCTDAETKTISEDMKKLIQKTWKSNLKKTLGFTITYNAETTDADATIVNTTATPANPADSIDIGYKMKKIGGKLKAVDIETESVWMVGNWHTQFTKIIGKDGCGALIKKLSDKLAQS